MKLALCFSGQPRFVRECSQSIISNVIQNYDVDIFAHLWFDENLQNNPYKFGGSGGWQSQRISNSAVDDFQKIYNPVDLLIEPSRLFGDSDLGQEVWKENQILKQDRLIIVSLIFIV
jgi:hypothetical protein